MDIFGNLNIKYILNLISGFVDLKNPLDIIRALIDISIVSYVAYKIILLVKETRALQVIKGILILLVFQYMSGLLGLKTIAYILQITFQSIAIALVVLFQPELRKGLEQIGRSKFRDFFNFEEEDITLKTASAIEEIIKAASEMSKKFTGALIIVERETKLGDIINTGVNLDSNLASEIIVNIFAPNTPLHDGALIIRDNKVKAAGCYLPLTENPNLSKELGTRHRAALGITEVSDCIAVIVSEQTGIISFALNGGLARNLTPDTLRLALNKNLLEKNAGNKKLNLWKMKAR